jgi:hypothetical protein
MARWAALVVLAVSAAFLSTGASAFVPNSPLTQLRDSTRRYVSELDKSSTNESDSLANDVLALGRKIPRTLRTTGRQRWRRFRRGGQTCAGQYIHIYTDTRMFIAQFVCRGWFQVYIIRTHISGICDVETECLLLCVLGCTQEHITIEFPSTLTSQIKIFIVEYYIP